MRVNTEAVWREADVHFEMAICSKNRMIVATGSSGKEGKNVEADMNY